MHCILHQYAALKQTTALWQYRVQAGLANRIISNINSITVSLGKKYKLCLLGRQLLYSCLPWTLHFTLAQSMICYSIVNNRSFFRICDWITFLICKWIKTIHSPKTNVYIKILRIFWFEKISNLIIM